MKPVNPIIQVLPSCTGDVISNTNVHLCSSDDSDDVSTHYGYIAAHQPPVCLHLEDLLYRLWSNHTPQLRWYMMAHSISSCPVSCTSTDCWGWDIAQSVWAPIKITVQWCCLLVFRLPTSPACWSLSCFELHAGHENFYKIKFFFSCQLQNTASAFFHKNLAWVVSHVLLLN